MLLWCDLETTGLCARSDVVLEVAAIITDDVLAEVARFHCVTDGARMRAYEDLDPVVRDMHYENGLWMESLRSNLRVNGEGDGCSADDQLQSFIRQYCPDVVPERGGAKSGPQLAGSTISFDRAFIAEHLPGSHQCLHYRNLDVSTLNEVARRFWPAVWKERPRGIGNKHRAMADVEESLAVARYYVAQLGPLATPSAQGLP